VRKDEDSEEGGGSQREGRRPRGFECPLFHFGRTAKKMGLSFAMRHKPNVPRGQYQQYNIDYL
jgi:hypothetical protein